ncbi:hypothetical protein F183_A29810 [Bryobacterales bacterium F-183]|nr:hypothetical protein F183_A29810 [Bryobacterales bacterium F-183]
MSGSRFRAIILNDDHGVILAASMERQKDMVSATIVVANLHEKQLDVMPSEITLHDLGANSRTLEIVPPEKVAAKALKGTWEEFFLGISASGANTTVHTAKGDSFEVPDVEARANATRTLNERAAEKRQRAADVNSSALREHTLFQRQNTVGKLHFKAGKPAPKEVVLRVPLRGLIYEIPFELPAK